MSVGFIDSSCTHTRRAPERIAPRDQVSADLPPGSSACDRRIRARMLVERNPKYHRYIPHNRGPLHVGVKAVRSGHSREIVLMKSLRELERSLDNALKDIMFF